MIVKQLIWGSLNGLRIRQSLMESLLSIHTLDRDTGPLEGTAVGSWSLGFVEQSQGEGCCWLWRSISRGYEGGDCGGKCLWRKAMEARWYCWVTHRGWSHYHSFSLPTCQHGSWTIERLAHQMPDALNYRLGPHPGCSFKWLTCQSTE